MKSFSSIFVAASVLALAPTPATAQDQQSIMDKACALGAAECTAPAPMPVAVADDETQDGPRTPVAIRPICLPGICAQATGPSASSRPRAANLVRSQSTTTPGMARPRQRTVANPADIKLAFANNSAELSGDGQRILRDWAAAIVNSPSLAAARFAVGGHTNSIGSRESNIDLSQRRAQAVVDYMVSRGVARDHLSARGYGFDAPLPGVSPTAPANRRVAIIKN